MRQTSLKPTLAEKKATQKVAMSAETTLSKISYSSYPKISAPNQQLKIVFGQNIFDQQRRNRWMNNENGSIY